MFGSNKVTAPARGKVVTVEGCSSWTAPLPAGDPGRLGLSRIQSIRRWYCGVLAGLLIVALCLWMATGIVNVVLDLRQSLSGGWVAR